MSERHTFGPRLRSERERRGITLDKIVAVTKVGADLWEGLERNDFSRWPSGIFARAFVRDYARAVGLDADEVVDEFCRLFPTGDRRTDRVIKAQAQLIGHSPLVDEAACLPPGGDRRNRGRERDESRTFLRVTPRVVAAAVDATVVLFLGALGSFLFHTSFWASAGVMALIYHAGSTIGLGASAGTRAADLLRQRVPALFAVHDRRAHA
jgi:transcriptional regulator with XRE-family HTH domain